MIYIRTDANEIIATGHVMRCLTIAQEISELGSEVCFIVSDEQSLPLICDNGYRYIVTDSQWNRVNPQEEFRILKEYINETDTLLVDSYYLNNDYLKCMMELCKVATFDDLFTEKKDADIIINYNIFYKIFNYAERYKNSKSKLLLGESYVPLRRQFSEIEPLDKVREYMRPTVLLMCGGGDTQNFICSCLGYIRKNDIELFRFIDWKVVIGSYYPHERELDSINSTVNNIEIFKNIKDMAELMKKCDICITAASTVLYECCAMLLPTIYVTVAKDQVYDADAFSENQMMIYCGNFQEEKDKVNKALSQMARDIINNKQLQQIMKNKMKIIKRNGAKNIATSLCGGNQ